MKYKLFIFIILTCHFHLIAQDQDLKTVFVNENVSTHFVCSEPVQYVDISTDHVVGDIPISNMVRIKPKKSMLTGQTGMKSELGVVTIVAEQYMIQYKMEYVEPGKADKKLLIEQTDGVGLMFPEMKLTHKQMISFSTKVLETSIIIPRERNYANGIEARLNQIYTIGDYYFLDLTIINKTKISYDIDQFRFKIEDKKITKATNVQSIEIEPEFQYHHQKSFQKHYRNVFVFRKFTYPNKKVFSIELTEKQISGRNLALQIDYRDVLSADTF